MEVRSHKVLDFFFSMRIEEEIKQSRFRNPHQKAVLNVIYTAGWLAARQKGFFREFGLTARQFNALRILRGQYPKSISATDIRSRMLDKNSDVSRLLDRLAAKELIVRKACEKDKRAADLFITNKGLELLTQVDRHIYRIDNIFTLSDDEATQLSNLLDKCRSGDS